RSAVSSHVPTEEVVATVAGRGTYGVQDGTGADALFRSPEGVAITPSGEIIVTDRANNSMRKLTVDGVVTTIFGDGSSGFADGDASTAKLSYPWKSCVDK